MEGAWPPKIVHDDPLMGVTGRWELEPFLLTGMRARYIIDRIIGATDGRATTGLLGGQGGACLQQRLGQRHIVEPGKTHTNARVKKSLPSARGSCSSHHAVAKASRRRSASSTGSVVSTSTRRSSQPATSGSRSSATTKGVSGPKAASNGARASANR